MIHDYDTIAYHKSERPGTMARDLSQVPLSVAGKTAKANLNSAGQKSPESEALEFYLLQHAMGEIEAAHDPDEPLGSKLPLVERFHEVLNSAGSRLFQYILITTTRESRHLTNVQEDQLIQKYGSQCADFTKKVKSGAQKALFNYSGDLKLGPYLDYLVDVFNTLSWSSSYGGKPWGSVTEAIRDTVNGKISVEMMLDIGYALAHNNGPIFNKGFQFTHYDAFQLYTILDCQRAGQIPNLIKSGSPFCTHVQNTHSGDLFSMETLLKTEYDSWVDWDVVEALGAVQTYDQYKSANMQKFGNDPKFKAANAAVLEKVAAAKDAAAAKKAAHEKLYFEVMPGVKIKKAVKARDY